MNRIASMSEFSKLRAIPALGMVGLLLSASAGQAATTYTWNITSGSGAWTTTGDWTPTAPAGGPTSTDSIAASTSVNASVSLTLATNESVVDITDNNVNASGVWTITTSNAGTDVLTSTGTISAGSGASNLVITGASATNLLGVSANNISVVGTTGNGAQMSLGTGGSTTKYLSSLSANATTVTAGSLFINVQNATGAGNASNLGLLTVGKVGATSGLVDLNDFGNGAPGVTTDTSNVTVTGIQDSATGGAFISASKRGIVGGTVDNANLIVNVSGANSYSTVALLRDNTGAAGSAGGVLSLAKQGSGTQTLTQTASTYTGSTTISGGILNVAKLAASGSASSIGQATSAAANLVLDGGTLQYTGTTATSTDHNYTLTTNGGSFDASGTTLGTLTLSGNMTASGTSGSQTLTLTGTGAGSTGSGTLSGTVNDGTGTNTTALLKTGAGLWILSGANTYSGGTTVNGGTLQISGSGVIGSTSGALTVTSGTFDLNGTNQAVGNLTGAGGTITNNGGTAKTLTIGTGNNGGGSYAGAINNGASVLGLTKTGTGTIALAGSNGYSGATTVAGGNLTITGSTASGSTITVGNGTSTVAILSGSGTVHGGVSLVTSGSDVAYLAPGVNSSGTRGDFGSAGTLTVGGALSIGTGTVLDIDLASTTTIGGGVNDLISMSGGGTLSFGSSFTINYNQSGLTTGSAYTLINGFSGTPTLPTSANITSNGITGYTASYSIVSGALDVTFSSVGAATAAYFNGAANDMNTAGNFDTSVSSATANTSAPTGVTNVFFSANRNASTTPNISAPLEVNSVNFGTGSGTNSGITVSSSNTSDTLQIDATSANGNMSGSGVTITGGGADTISAPVVLGGSQSWATDSGSKLTVSGQVSGAYALTKAGAGAVVLSHPSGNTYTGGTTVSAGTLYVNNTSNSGTGTGAVTVNSGGTLAGNGIISTSSGATVNGGGKLVSGDPSQVSGTGLSTKGGMTFASTALTVGSNSGTANLMFDLGSGTSGINGGTASGAYDFSNPNDNTTYLKLTGSSSINFAGATSISLVDLTNTTGSNGSLSLRLSSPYLLIHAGSNADYLNLVINSGTNANPIYSLSQNDAGVNGYVVGVYTGGAVNATDAAPISIAQYEADGLTALTPGPNGAYVSPALYLDAGNLEVVPEPGTWALMLGGVALLMVVQRRKNRI